MIDSNQSAETTDIPLCVDLDGTLIRSDVLWEFFIPLIKQPCIGIRAFWALLHGKAAMKSALAERITIAPEELPYREELLAFLGKERGIGRKLYLVTATHQSIADRIARHLGIFDGVLATDKAVNLGGEKKRQLLEEKFGYRGYDYIGDHLKDLPVFASARHSLLVEPSVKLQKKTVKYAEIVQIFPDQRHWFKILFQALRLHQWSKNALLGVPLVTAHLITDWTAWIHLVCAFFSFSMLASATYLINDLNDLPSDRQHTKKRYRPLASGDLPIPLGIALSLLLITIGFSLAWYLLNPAFIHYMMLYAVVTLAYSFDLKRRLVVDALTLAILYTLRIIAGGAAVNVPVSEWLLMFSLFIFISLAFLKRLIELTDKESKGQILGRGYETSDLDIIRSTGIASGLLSVLVFTLYINSPAVNALYSQPRLLWFLTPVLVYWIVRIWFQAERKRVNHDPIIYAMTDKRTYQVLVTSGIILLVAKLGLPGGYF